MKVSLLKSYLSAVLLLAGNLSLQAQTTDTWTGGGGDGDWNNGLNWDQAFPPLDPTTNAVIGVGNTVNYNSPMTAGSFGSLTLNGILNLNAGGFVAGASGNGAATVSGGAARVFVNSGGAFSATNGGLTFTATGGGAVATGGSLSLSGSLRMGASGAGNTGFMTNNGGTLAASSTSINPNNLSSSCNLIINGGTNDLGAVSILRSSSGSATYNAIGSEGLVISNGVVRMTSLAVGTPAANSALSMVLVNGIVTNSGAFTVQEVTSARGARFLQLGGLFVNTDPNPIRVGLTNAGQVDTFSVIGGTNICYGFLLGDITNNSGTINFTNAAKVYIGLGGMASNAISALNVALNSGGSFGANDDWSGSVSIILAGGAFDCATLDGTARNITLNNVLRGAGALNKNGAGSLILNATEAYTGNTLVNQGTLVLGAAGSISSTPQISVASGAKLDVSAVAGFTLGATRVLGGLGTVTGDVAVASSGIINPGVTTGTLTLANSLSVSGGAVLHFDLPVAPGPGNDLLVINGNLNASGVNSLEIVGGGSPGTVHTLIQYGGSFSGTLANFNISGASGVLSNNASTKTISLIVQAAIRAPTNVVWVGNNSVNDWDTVNRTNWLNTGTGLTDYFVTGDNALFNNTGVSHPIVNIVGNNAPASLTVGASGNYTFGGSGSITGSGSLLKTNTGTLTITNVNTFSGGVTIGGGVLEAGSLSIGGSPSSIGSAGVDPTKLVIDGGTLRYTGSPVSIDRPATLGLTGTVDIPSGTSLTTSGAIGGGGLTKIGNGTLALTSSGSYTNGTAINAGTFQVNNNTAAGTGGITNNAATLLLQGALVLDNIVDFAGNCSLAFNGVGGNNVALRGAWVGGGTVNVYFINSNTNQTFTMGGSGAGGGYMWDFSGTVDFGTNTGFLRINNDNSTFNFGSSNATFNVGTGNASLNQRNGGTLNHLGALIGGPNTKLSGRGNTGASGTTTYSIGGKNLDTTFQGEINNGSGTTALSKVGTGKLTLTGASIHTGSTTVESGILQVDGTFSASPVTVNGGTLSGNGGLGGSVTINSGATLSPGASVGQLTISNSLSLQSGSITIMELNKGTGTYDSILGLTSVGYSGTLIVTNLAGALKGGDIFKLFDAPSGTFSGAFESFQLPTLDPRLFWDTNSLLVDGTLRVATASITSVELIGPNISLSGNGGPPGSNYVVLTSTSVTLPLSAWTPLTTNQFDVNGQFSFSTPFNPAVPQRFYALRLP